MKRLIALLLVLMLALPVRSTGLFAMHSSACGAQSNGPLDARSANSTAILTLPANSSDSAQSYNITEMLTGKYPSLNILFSDSDFIILDIPQEIMAGCSPDTFLENLRSLSGAEFAEWDSPTFTASITNDHFSDTQYWLDNPASDIDIDVTEGWSAYAQFPSDKASQTAIVAIIDTGIDFSHPDLASAMWRNPGEIPGNGIDDDNNGFIDDVYGWDFYNGDASVCHYSFNEVEMANLFDPLDNDNHGTHCAGIIAAKAGNSIGIAGVAGIADVRLMSLKIHGGSDRSGTVSDAIRAIRYADMMGADVCNISWGSYSYSQSLYTAILRSPMLFVCAAGNDGTDNDLRPLYPASMELDNIISVAYTDANGNFTKGSNHGAESVDVAVPAVDVFSTVVGTYGSMSGSSMAAPQISGIAALLYTLHDGMYASNVRDVILSGVKPVDTCAGKTVCGGIPSLAEIMNNSGNLLSDSELPYIDVGLDFVGDELLLGFTVGDDGSGVNQLRYFTGKRSSDYFRRGTGGTPISDYRLALAKAGTYTFYVSDYAGNETIHTLRLMDDIVAPRISDLKVSVNSKRTAFTVSASVIDKQSGIRSVKYLKGVQTESVFRSANVAPLDVDADGNISFKVSEEGTYTIYACDRRGNTSLTYVYAYIRPATAITLSKTKKTLRVGRTWTLAAELTPLRSTDRVTFTSSDETIATVSSRGQITAVSEGSCVITASTNGGLSAECTIKVKPAEDEPANVDNSAGTGSNAADTDDSESDPGNTNSDSKIGSGESEVVNEQ